MAYAVGGCVRDSILNRKPKDWDIKHVVVDNEEFLYYKLPKLTVALIKGTAADKRGNISFDDMYMYMDNANELVDEVETKQPYLV